MPETQDEQALQAQAEAMAADVSRLRAELGKVIFGQEELLDMLILGLIAEGHVLIEGLPGLGKTRLARGLAQCMGLEFSRIQFTPDLMPADVTGTRVIEEQGGERQFRFQKGPVFTNLLLADEINRATPKTQSALLEAMQEASVTVAGTTHSLPRPFSVIATQNPIELEGTYPLPEAQLDRFLFKLKVAMPAAADLVTVLDRTTIQTEGEPAAVMDGARLRELQAFSRGMLCGEHLLQYVAELILATHPSRDSDATTQRLVRFGASPRAGQAMVLSAKARALLDGRPCVSREDLDAVAPACMRHRVVLSFEAEAEDIGVEELLPAWSQTAARRAGG